MTAELARPSATGRIALPSSTHLPLQGFGFYKVLLEQAEDLVVAAIPAGYRLIDTAAFNQNEEAVGAAIQRLINEGVVRREDLFVTSKLWNNAHGYRSAHEAFEASRNRLRPEYLNLYLIHWPCPDRDLYQQTWSALEEIAAEGLARAIGTSNFLPEHLQQLLCKSSTAPAVNHIELHPWLQQSQAREFHAWHGIATQAWSPLTRGRALKDLQVLRLAAELAQAPARLVLRWLRDLGISAIPKTLSAQRIRKNVNLPAAALPADVLTAMQRLERGQRVGSDPKEVS